MKTAPYGEWKSPVTSDLIGAKSIGLSEIRLDGDSVYWLELRPNEGGRYALVERVAGGDADLVPPAFSVRTRVHEYGGGAWTVARGTVYFSNDRDRRLYRLDRGSSQPVPITPEGAMRYADGVVDAARNAWIGIRQDGDINTIVSIALGGEPDAGTVLASGHDFYASPRLSPDGRRLAYLSWDHPRMPWEGTTLYVLHLESGETTEVAGGAAESIFQPEWAPDSGLLFVSDRTGWWNLYRTASDLQSIEPLAPMEAEFGQPQWVFGMSAYTFAEPNRLVCSYASKGLQQLGVLDLNARRLDPLDLPYTEYSSVRAEGSKVVFRAGSSASPGQFVRLDLDTGETQVLKKTTDVADDPELAKYFTAVETVEFPTEGGLTAFGLFYPAYNPDYTAPEGDRPPLLVKCHGGPTAAASSTLDLRIQFWTSRGISVLDVNYGGSTGFGRAYRRRLEGNWGIVDVDDCVNGARYLAAQGRVDGQRSVITGSSAGGYTVLAALTFRDYFAGGASHYGVSELTVLARDTHKFEARYLDSLIGPWPEREDLYRERSPIAYVERLSAPVIFFQGDEDTVVLPEQSEMMVNGLRRKGTPVGYILFSGEQHGFRKAENIKRSLDAELYFYAINVFRTGLVF